MNDFENSLVFQIVSFLILLSWVTGAFKKLKYVLIKNRKNKLIRYLILKKYGPKQNIERMNEKDIYKSGFQFIGIGTSLLIFYLLLINLFKKVFVNLENHPLCFFVIFIYNFLVMFFIIGGFIVLLEGVFKKNQVSC